MKNLVEIIKELQYLRDETNHPSCDPESEEYTTECICSRFDSLITDLAAKHAVMSLWLRMIADPKHSDEGEYPDDYLSDGEMIDLMVKQLKLEWGLDLEDFKAEFAATDSN